jgi:hypothetical protein
MRDVVERVAVSRRAPFLSGARARIHIPRSEALLAR